MKTKYSHDITKIFNYTRILARMCGADVINKNYKRSWLTWLMFAAINGGIAISFYTIYVGVAVSNDWTDILKCLCTLGKGFQGYAKLVNVLLRPELTHSIYTEIIGIYSVYEQKDVKYQRLLKDSIAFVRKLLAVLLASVAFVIVVVISVPVIYQIAFNERLLIIHLFLPYIDHETDFGYLLISLFHVFCVVFATVGSLVSDSWCFLFAAHIPLMKNILHMKFEELSKVFEDEDKDLKMAQVKLFDTLKWHQKYIRFCDSIEESFFWVIFVQIATEFGNIVSTVVCIFFNVWPAAPSYLIYSFFSLYIHCALGNLVELSNDEVTVMIYDSCWYNLTVPQQKMVLLMLRRAQQAEGMTIGGVAPLSMNTALQLTKTIYTFSMMLQQFLN